MERCFDYKLSEFLEQISETAGILFADFTELKEAVEKVYGDNKEAFIDDVSHSADYYTLKNLIEYCYKDFIN